MEDFPDLNDWEMVVGSNLAKNKSVEVLDEGTEDGAIKANYFALDYGGRRQIASEEESFEGSNDSDNPSWVDPDSDPKLLEVSKGKMDFVGMKLGVRNSDSFWSDELSYGQGSLPDSEKVVLANTGYSVSEAAIEERVVAREDLGGESEGTETSYTQDMIPVGNGDNSSGGERRDNAWWKMPLELLKFCIFRPRPVWSISIAAAMVGIAMLGRKLYRMKHKSRIIPLKIAIDDKSISQFAARSARLKAISLVRYMPLIRSSIPAGGATQWAALPQA